MGQRDSLPVAHASVFLDAARVPIRTWPNRRVPQNEGVCRWRSYDRFVRFWVHPLDVVIPPNAEIMGDVRRDFGPFNLRSRHRPSRPSRRFVPRRLAEPRRYGDHDRLHLRFPNFGRLALDESGSARTGLS